LPSNCSKTLGKNSRTKYFPHLDEKYFHYYGSVFLLQVACIKNEKQEKLPAIECTKPTSADTLAEKKWFL
jgi:hypothetical protein